MSWSKSISLDVANKLFDVIGVLFEQNELEGGYVAKHQNKTGIISALVLLKGLIMRGWVNDPHSGGVKIPEQVKQRTK